MRTICYNNIFLHFRIIKSTIYRAWTLGFDIQITAQRIYHQINLVYNLG